jgi:L-threonylcarbamoyladenylate synthase
MQVDLIQKYCHHFSLAMNMNRIECNSPNSIKDACEALARGELIIYPTETSYGLGADATNPIAIEKLLTYKGNRLNKALSVAVANQRMAETYIVMNPVATNVFETLLPGPITVIAQSQGKVAPKVESERHTLGIRYSSLPWVQELALSFGKPITATSANTSGVKQIFSFDEWQRYVSPNRQEMISLFMDTGTLPSRSPSTIVDTTLENPEILRQGDIVMREGATHFESHAVDDTIDLGKQLIAQQADQLATHPLIIALQGDLGAGKTHFAKGIGQALGITEMINSPTYTIMKEYPYSTSKSMGVFYHVDTWRLFEGETVQELGIESRIGAGDVIAIEWQEKAHEWIEQFKKPITIAWVQIQTISETDRLFSIQWEHKS